MGRLAGKTVLMYVGDPGCDPGGRKTSERDLCFTGASAGIGAACAVEFAKEGCKLILAARRKEKLVEVQQQIAAQVPGVSVQPLELDVRDRQKVFDAIATLDPVDILINNAGLVIGLDTIATVTPTAIDTMLDTNVKGLLNVTQAVLPSMQHRNAGHIINVSSISGRETYPGGGVYCASKHAVDALTRTLRMELVDSGINVTSIDPGLVETEFSIVRFAGDRNKAEAVYKGMQPLTPTDIAETVVFAASRPPHVQIASVLILPSAQAAATMVARKQ
ncbi:hypothetical protein PhCBS80983_g04146 [Powellomyces hirtus]|uniref:Uncharacterized protein n=1 Tax=Powellomyces hirtus TaxID=109895 RepID=A0A507DYW0_9FUNG|nr:hypothetical protein PhCBS80983_g04146 [Powellomyces hirtus]